MHRKPLVAAIVALALILPMAAQAAGPTGMTRLNGASAFFTGPAIGEDCVTDHLVITYAEDAYQALPGDNDAPRFYPWFDVQVWQESGCESPGLIEGSYDQETVGVEKSKMDALTAAFAVASIDLHDENEAVYRSFTFDVAWVADDPIGHAADRNEFNRFVGKSVGAHFTGAFTDSEGLIGLDDLDYADMGSGTYLFYQ